MLNPLVAYAEYQTESVFDSDYKCVATEEGGYNHIASGHDPARYRPETEFFLTHISNLRKETVFNMKSESILERLNYDEDLIRSEVEASYMEQERPYEGYVNETNSYFIREPHQGPVNATFHGKCQAFWSEDGKSINCDVGLGSQSQFVFNIDTGKFVYSYLGSWHLENEDGYYGDSSVFAFGECKKYYR